MHISPNSTNKFLCHHTLRRNCLNQIHEVFDLYFHKVLNNLYMRLFQLKIRIIVIQRLFRNTVIFSFNSTCGYFFDQYSYRYLHKSFINSLALISVTPTKNKSISESSGSCCIISGDRKPPARFGKSSAG